ncbi:MAG TPA: hypothetical protein VM597_01765 [Gemmataceae bacterium]|jgi:hypothetical protein|nr:hypothetical protein [Gemmataceae bacterium]
MSNVAYAYVDTRAGKGFGGMEEYFRLAKRMPLSPYHQDLYVEKAFAVPNMSLTELALEMAINHRPGVNAVIYCHGDPRQLVFPIDPSDHQKKNYLDTTDAARVSYHLDLIAAKQLVQHKDQILDPFIASKYPASVKFNNVGFYNEVTPDYLKINKVKGDARAREDAVSTADGLMASLAHIRGLKIPHLAIRACRVGQSPDLMKYVGMMLGTKSVSAPRLRTASFGGRLPGIQYVPADKKADFAKQFTKSKHGQGGTHLYEYANPLNKFGITDPLRFTFRVVYTGKSRFRLDFVYASEEEALSEFLWRTAGYTELMSKVRALGGIALHALVGPSQRLIFPTEPEYLTHMAFVNV